LKTLENQGFSSDGQAGYCTKNWIRRRSGVSYSLHGRTGTPLFSCPLLRSRGRKSLATSGFPGAYLVRKGIYTLSPETALLLRNKSKAKELW